MEAIPVFYSPQQVAHPVSFSPSPGKPADVVADWLAAGLPIKVRAPESVRRDMLARAHEREFVDAILDCRRRNGFGDMSPAVAGSLPWTSGSLLSAAREALCSGKIAASPTSGFHHAGYDFAGGFCTFNGLMVTALQLKDEGLVHRVGILDCDMHYGNGTEDIIETFGIDWIRHITASAGYRTDAQSFLARLPELVRGFADCDLLLYQAGADPHVDDPLGGFLTTAQLAERDRIVFAMAKRIGLPVVWNLAGGYQEPLGKVLAIHRNTMIEACAAYCETISALQRMLR